jgi:hypothetical protein
MKYALHKKENGRLWWWDATRARWSNQRWTASRFTYKEARAEQEEAGGNMAVLWNDSLPLTSNIPF